MARPVSGRQRPAALHALFERSHAREGLGHPVDGQTAGADRVAHRSQRDLGGGATVG